MNTHAHALGFPSASKMWVNEAQPGGAVSYTHTSSLIRGSGGVGVGVGLRDTQHTNIKGGSVAEQFIRHNDGVLCVNGRSPGR